MQTLDTLNGYGDDNYATSHPLLGEKSPLTYEQCLDIYTYWPLGKRVASALPNFALSAERGITFGDLPPSFMARFNEISKDYGVDSIVKKLTTFIRIFGMAGLYVAHSDVDETRKLTYKDFSKGRIAFNILDPFMIAGSTINEDPLSTEYSRLSDIRILEKTIEPSRCYVGYNNLTFYMQYTQSAYNFGPTSIYQNMLGLIYSWNRCVVALERCATKAGSIVVKNRSSSLLSSIGVQAAEKTLDLIRNMQNDGIAGIEKDADIEFFNLTGVGEIDSIITQLNNIMMMALSDTPSAILLDKELAQGFGDGSEDMKAILMSVNDFREQHLRGIYDFLDKHLLYLAFTDEWLKQEIEDGEFKADLRGESVETLREKVLKEFKFEWGNLYPETEATRIDNAGRKLDNLIKLKDLGANLADLEQIINNDKDLYQEDIKLEEQMDEMAGFGDEGSGNEDSESSGGQSSEDNPSEKLEETIAAPKAAPSPSSDEE